MKALTLHQPWASLLAEGVKTIETRSWSTKYRGPLAIHAGKHCAKLADAPWGRFSTEEYRATRGYAGSQEFADGLPLGAVVATCTLVDVVPAESLWICDPVQWGDSEEDIEHLRLAGWGRDGGDPAFVISDQLPYGDFSAGRFLWLLEFVHELPEPIEAKGKLGLWEWER